MTLSDFIYKVLIVVVAIIIANIIIKKFMPDKPKIVKLPEKKEIHRFFTPPHIKNRQKRC